MSKQDTISDGFNWNSIEKKDAFANFDPNTGNKLVLKMLGDPKVVSRDFDGDGNFKDQRDFPVIDQADDCPKMFSVSSNRLMLLLKDMRPLAGKVLEIQRSGEGYETTYTVQGLPE